MTNSGETHKILAGAKKFDKTVKTPDIDHQSAIVHFQILKINKNRPTYKNLYYL